MLYVILALMVLCDNGLRISLGTWIVTVLLTLWTLFVGTIKFLNEKGGDDS
mgnify:CR=1 FL=1